MRSLTHRMMLFPAALWLATATWLPAQEEPKLTEDQMRVFLLNAKVVSGKTTAKGITAPSELTLSDGTITHKAAFQKVNEYKAMQEFPDGHREVNFKDCYKFDIAAYELAKLLGLGDMMPVTVERKYKGDSGAMSWWLPVKMDEANRLRKKIEPPDAEAWNRQMYKKRIFAELVYDTDPNLTNVLISEEWHLWMIDFTRAFRTLKEIRDPRNILETKCERHLLDNMRKLAKSELTLKTKGLLTPSEVDGVMGRRDKIVKMYDDLIAKKGEEAGLYDDAAGK